MISSGYNEPFPPKPPPTSSAFTLILLPAIPNIFESASLITPGI